MSSSLPSLLPPPAAVSSDLAATPSGAARRVSFGPPRPPERSRTPLHPDVLLDIAQGLARAEDLWRPHVEHDPHSRTAVRLVNASAYEVWLLGWYPGQSVEFHDHGSSHAAFTVVEGELTELALGFAGITSRRIPQGGIGVVAAGAVHDVVNAGARPSTSIHVYADPLTTMTYYDADGSPTRTEAVHPGPAVLEEASVALASHPARVRASEGYR